MTFIDLRRSLPPTRHIGIDPVLDECMSDLRRVRDPRLLPRQAAGRIRFRGVRFVYNISLLQLFNLQTTSMTLLKNYVIEPTRVLNAEPKGAVPAPAR